MSEARRLAWIADGSPFRLMQPAADLRDTLRRHGYTVYDLGNEAHLEHDPPEDHTPYSATGWPSRARYGRGYAIDIMPPSVGQVSRVDGLPLPSLQQLGAQLLADRKAGVAGIRWLKYMNWEPAGQYTGPCYQESWKPDYARRSSSDRGHIHASGLTGFEDSTIGAGYDPVARIRGDDMPGYGFDDPKQPDDVHWRTGALREEHKRQDAVLAEILANVKELRGQDWTDEQAIADAVLAGLATRSTEDVARALVAAGQDPAQLAAALTALTGE